MYLLKLKIIKQRKIKKLFSLFLLSLINMIPTVAQCFFLKREDYIKNIGVLFTILFYIIFKKLFLKTKIYKHQIISLLIISFCLLIFTFNDIKNAKSDSKSDFFKGLGISLLYILIVFGFYAIYDVLIKKHLEKYSDDPYYLMFYIGLFSLILTIPLDLFSYFYDDEGKKIELDAINQIRDLYKKYKLKFFLWFLSDIIIGFFWLVGIILILYYFTPCHFIICRTLSEFLSKCVRWVLGKDKDEWYEILIYSLIYVIIIFSSFIYNEVIIIHLYGMEENTFKYISFREKLELENPIDNHEENLTGRNSISSENEEIDEEK